MHNDPFLDTYKDMFDRTPRYLKEGNAPKDPAIAPVIDSDGRVSFPGLHIKPRTEVEKFVLGVDEGHNNEDNASNGSEGGQTPRGEELPAFDYFLPSMHLNAAPKSTLRPKHPKHVRIQQLQQQAASSAQEHPRHIFAPVAPIRREEPEEKHEEKMTTIPEASSSNKLAEHENHKLQMDTNDSNSEDDADNDDDGDDHHRHRQGSGSTSPSSASPKSSLRARLARAFERAGELAHIPLKHHEEDHEDHQHVHNISDKAHDHDENHNPTSPSPSPSPSPKAIVHDFWHAILHRDHVKTIQPRADSTEGNNENNPLVQHVEPSQLQQRRHHEDGKGLIWINPAKSTPTSSFNVSPSNLTPHSRVSPSSSAPSSKNSKGEKLCIHLFDTPEFENIQSGHHKLGNSSSSPSITPTSATSPASRDLWKIPSPKPQSLSPRARLSHFTSSSQTENADPGKPPKHRSISPRPPSPTIGRASADNNIHVARNQSLPARLHSPTSIHASVKPVPSPREMSASPSATSPKYRNFKTENQLGWLDCSNNNSPGGSTAPNVFQDDLFLPKLSPKYQKKQR